MKILSIVEILNGNLYLNSQITVRGWVRTRRDSKLGISFISIYDGSCLNNLQVIANNSLYNYQNEILRLSSGCSIIVTGKIVISSGKKQQIEIASTNIKVIGWVDDANTYPIAAKRHSLEFLREVIHLRPRTYLISAISRVRHTIAQAIHSFFHENGYIWIPTPIITAYDTEGIKDRFRISTFDLNKLPHNNIKNIDFHNDFFGKETFLTGSGQLHAESYACALTKVYTFGPTFRAEPSNTSRHLAEFWMIEPEVAFATLHDIIILAENLLKFIFKIVLIERADDMDFFAERIDKDIIYRLEKFISSRLIILDYSEAINILLLSQENFENPVFWGIDLSSEHERFLVQHYLNVPIVVKNYPKNIKAFYMRINDDAKTVASMDILFPGIGEIIGGSQREERLHLLDERINDMGLNKEEYSWYRDLRRYGTVPHSGFGLGLERLIAYITGIQNIKDLIPFPRTPKNAIL
ncbi:MAG: asparagine--tRNA ligase [Candidatus Dasytiphilus stammeri]